MHQGRSKTGGALFDWSTSSDVQFKVFSLQDFIIAQHKSAWSTDLMEQNGKGTYNVW